MSLETIISRSHNSDPASIFTLDLSSLNMTRLDPAINACVNLQTLVLDRNPLVDFTAVDASKLSKLTSLSVRHCGLASLDSLARFQALTSLNAAGNKLSSVENDVADFAMRAPLVTRLDLQTPDGKDANPVCQKKDYTAMIQRVFPALRILDGHRLISQQQTVAAGVESLLSDFPALPPAAAAAEAAAEARATLAALAAAPPAQSWGAASNGGNGASDSSSSGSGEKLAKITPEEADERMEKATAPVYDALALCVKADQDAAALEAKLTLKADKK